MRPRLGQRKRPPQVRGPSSVEPPAGRSTRSSLADLADDGRGPGDLLAGERLATAAQIFGQEGLRPGVEVDPGLGPGEDAAPPGQADGGRAARRAVWWRGGWVPPPPFFSIAAAICSDSACLTRGSLPPWPIRSGR